MASEEFRPNTEGVVIPALLKKKKISSKKKIRPEGGAYSVLLLPQLIRQIVPVAVCAQKLFFLSILSVSYTFLFLVKGIYVKFKKKFYG